MDRLLPLPAVARRLAVTPERLRAWVESGRGPVPVVLPGGRWRWRESDLVAWVDALPRAVVGTPARRPVAAPAPDLSDLPELGREIIQALTEAGGWVTGTELARLIGGDCDHDSGTWRRVVRVLRDRGLIVTDRHRGYRLSP